MNSLSRRYSFLIVLAAFLAAATALGNSALKFYWQVNDRNIESEVAHGASRSSAAVLPNVAYIARLGWFGHSAEEEALAPGSPGTGNASALELKGVSQSEHANVAGAYISEQGQEEKYYRVGDSLPGDAGVLEGVFSDHITIRQGQSVNTLSFPRE